METVATQAVSDDLDAARANIAHLLVERDAVDMDDARTPPVLFNFSPETLGTEVIDAASRLMARTRKRLGLEYHAVLGIPHSGSSFAVPFERYTGAARIEMQTHGGHLAHVKGAEKLSPKIRVVLPIDGIATDGKILIQTVTNLRDKDAFVVNDAIVLLDLEQGAPEALAGIGVTLHSMITVSELLEYRVKAGKLSPFLRTKALQYLFQV